MSASAHDIVWPDYARCSVNLVSSIGAFFGLQQMHHGLPEVSGLLESKAWRSVVLLVLDGLGSVSLSELLPEDAFMRRKHLLDLSAVFPSTTVAATTSLRSGLYPNEHGWLGWTMYFPQCGQSVDVFSNRIQFTQELAAEKNLGETFLPFSRISRRIWQEGLAEGFSISRHDALYASNIRQLSRQIVTTCTRPGRQYVYAYSYQPDTDMHEYGTFSSQAKNSVLLINQELEALANELPADVLLLVTADHGILDAKPALIEQHPALAAMLLRPPVLEPRACAFYIRAECRRDFPGAFAKAFGDSFLLMKSGQALSDGLFGPGDPREGTVDYLGDFLALAVAEKAIFMKQEHCRLIGMHAGLTRREMVVPLLAIARQ